MNSLKIKLLLVAIFTTAFIYVGTSHSYASFEGNTKNHNIYAQLNTDNSNNVNIRHTFDLVGDSDTKLTSGVELKIPYDNFEVISVGSPQRRLRFSKDGNFISIKLFENFLKSTDTIKIEVNYSITNHIKDIWRYKTLKLFRPSENVFNYTVVNNGSLPLSFTNLAGNKLTGSTNSEIIAMWGQKISNFHFEYNLQNIPENYILPFWSENTGHVEIDKTINGNLGLYDDLDNFFLIKGSSNTLSGTVWRDTENKFGFPLKNLGVDTSRNYVISDKYQFEDGVNELLKSDKINNFESAILESKKLTNEGITNRVVYGFINTPDNEIMMNFWVEYLDQEELKVIDKFFNYYFGYSTKYTYPVRIPVVVIDDSNIDKMTNILSLASINPQIEVLNEITDKNEVSPAEFFIDTISLDQLNLIVQNNGNFPVKIAGSDDSTINNEIEHLLILPGYTGNIPIYTKVKEGNFIVNYQINDQPFSTTFQIENNIIHQEVYLRIAFAIFGIISVTLIFYRGVIYNLIHSRILIKIKNRLKMREM